MTDLPAARRGDTTLTLIDLLRREHQRGRLVPLLRRAATEAFLLGQAKALGLSVDAAELQRAADLVRRRRGLLSAAQTTAWLATRRLSVDDFEAGLESSLLLAKLRRHVSDKAAAERFAAAPADYDRVELRVAVLPTEDLAREILSQVEEGRDFGELARKHSKHRSATNAGLLKPRFRSQLAEPIRAAVVTTAKPGAVAGPVATPEGFLLARVERMKPAELDAPTAGYLNRVVYFEWLRGRLEASPFSAPLLDGLA